jgi:hypothetical protein
VIGTGHGTAKELPPIADVAAAHPQSVREGN